jgi:hypothetical protein
MPVVRYIDRAAKVSADNGAGVIKEIAEVARRMRASAAEAYVCTEYHGGSRFHHISFILGRRVL